MNESGLSQAFGVSVDAASDFARLLGAVGVNEALAFLNHRAPHRFTGIYRFEGRLLRCVALSDCEDPSVTCAEDVIVTNTYCGLVREFSTAFGTDDSLQDPRLADHPARAAVRSYHGVPLLDEAERCIGALSHWDVVPRALPPDEFRLLFTVAPIVGRRVLQVRAGRQTAQSVRLDAQVSEAMDEAQRKSRFTLRLPRLLS